VYLRVPQFFVSKKVFDIIGILGLMVKLCGFPVAESVKGYLRESRILELGLKLPKSTLDSCVLPSLLRMLTFTAGLENLQPQLAKGT
jgi:hypothetical protein